MAGRWSAREGSVPPAHLVQEWLILGIRKQQVLGSNPSVGSSISRTNRTGLGRVDAQLREAP
jgi:hypothetical protein